jgi:hypothetical protein
MCIFNTCIPQSYYDSKDVKEKHEKQFEALFSDYDITQLTLERVNQEIKGDSDNLTAEHLDLLREACDFRD